MHRLFTSMLFLSLALTLTTVSLAQAPDWMFALEGAYVGRMEVKPLNGNSELVTVDARLDGKRSGSEDGFVLQLSRETPEGIEKEAQMWSWNSQEELLDITAIREGQRIENQWFASQNGPAVLLTRGGSVGGQAAIERLRLERLPGQLRLTKQYNIGDGEWTLLWRYVLDDFVAED